MPIDQNLIAQLRPQFTDSDIEDLKQYFLFNQKYQDELNSDLTNHVKNDPVFGPILESQSKEQQKEQQQVSQQLQHDAIFEGRWDPYTEHFIMQGSTYAKMGLTFAKWYEVVRMVKDFVKPYALKEHKKSPQKVAAVYSGLGKLSDYAMHAIAESFIVEKNKLIAEEQFHREQVRKSEAFLSSLIENIPNMIFVKDAKDLRFIRFNKAGEELLGHSRKDMLGKNDYDFFPKKEADFFTKKDREVLTSGKMADIPEEHIETKDKSIRILHTKKIPLYNERGEPEYLLGISEDITEARHAQEALEEEVKQRKRAEKKVRDLNRQLKKQVEQLEATNDELESFTYSVSHDLRAPLRAIHSFAKVVNKKYGNQLDADGQRYLNIIGDNATKMGALIDDLLAFSRMGRQDVNPGKVDLGMLVNDVFEQLKPTPLNGRQVELQVEEMPQIQADREMMRHVVQNLLDNAIKYTAPREKAVIQAGSFQKDGDTVYFIQDNGVGFDMKYVDNLFGVFHRLHDEEEFEGTGVGLAIVQRIIHKHQGHVWAKAEEGKGATLYFTIPEN